MTDYSNQRNFLFLSKLTYACRMLRYEEFIRNFKNKNTFQQRSATESQKTIRNLEPRRLLLSNIGNSITGKSDLNTKDFGKICSYRRFKEVK